MADIVIINVNAKKNRKLVRVTTSFLLVFDIDLNWLVISQDTI